jgi:pyruvate/2-oxoglutarate dehydrogenase complex dihydrolipoamide dehydrogenase (E3) component
MPSAASRMPVDPADARLHRAAHPAGWTNPEPRGRYDLVVLGGGTAGLVCAMGAAGLGARVALVERALLGGDCLITGCVPSKALLRSARAAAEARRAPQVGVRVAEVEADFAAVMRRMRERRADISPHDSAERLRAAGVDVYFGDARFADASAIAVGSRRLTFRRAVIATGGRPAVPPFAASGGVPYLTNETLFGLTEQPRRLAIVGAGPIGCEMAQAFARLGTAVTLVDQAAQLLPREDADAAAILARQLAAEGVTLRLGATIAGVSTSSDGIRLRLKARAGLQDRNVGDGLQDRNVGDGLQDRNVGDGLEDRNVGDGLQDRNVGDGLQDRNVGDGLQDRNVGDGLQAVPFDADPNLVLCTHLLIATGRTPNVEDLNLPAAGVAFDQAGVVVDDRLRTTNPRVFAAGDVCSAFKFTHAADALARIVIQNALFFGRKRASALVIPWCTYTDPEVAHVGAYEDEARRAGRRVETITIPLADVDRAVVDEERDGFVRVHHERGRLLGCTVVASRAGEMIGVATHALTHGARLGDLGSTIQPYPTLNNAFRAAGDAYARTRLTPRARLVLRSYFRLFGK